jgi:peptidoglycan DL-endopeptidase CwlO
MTRVRRGTSRISCLLLGTALLVTALTPVSVGAQSITQTRARIARLSADLAAQERFSEITANEYDAAKVKLAQINAKITRLDARELAKRGAIKVTAKKLAVAVVRAYVVGAAEAQILGLFNQNVSTSDARRVYEQQVIGDLTALENNYQAQKNSLDATIAEVSAQRVKAQRQTATIDGLLVQNAHNEAVTRATLKSVTHKLASEIISYEIGAGVAAARRHNVAGEEQAVAAASEVGGQAAANKVLEAIQAATPPLVTGVAAGSAQGMAALHAAEKQLGVPYVWGGESPGHGFDCSGLVQWAWAQAGFAIPRTTQAEWPALRHIPPNALQPGDLLFYWNLDGDHQVDHVVMYAGSGPYGTSTIISAAHSGTVVSYAPLFTFGLIGAARP